MNISIDATGTRDFVVNEVAQQIKRARNDHQKSSPAIAALSDEIQRRIRNAPGEVITVHADLNVNVSVKDADEKVTSAAAAAVTADSALNEKRTK